MITSPWVPVVSWVVFAGAYCTAREELPLVGKASIGLRRDGVAVGVGRRLEEASWKTLDLSLWGVTVGSRPDSRGPYKGNTEMVFPFGRCERDVFLFPPAPLILCFSEKKTWCFTSGKVL